MDVIIQSNAEMAARTTAELIARALSAKPDLALGLATGCTMESVYDQLVRKHQKEGLDFSRCRTFNLDEYVGLAADDPCSYHYFMWRHFYDCGGPRYTAESVYPIDHIKREATES